MKTYKSIISLSKNERGIWDLDTIKGCKSGLLENDKGAILSVIKDFENNGHMSIFYKPLRKNVFELKVDTTQHNHRILGMMDKEKTPKLAVLTNAFDKKTNTTPDNEIELSIQRMKLYKNRELQ